MFWIAIAAQLSAPTPNEMWFYIDDTPVSYLGNFGSVRVDIRMAVAPDGKLQNCAIENSSGDADIDAYTCRLSVQRARFQPARLGDGTPAYGVLRIPVVWMINGSQYDSQSDLTITLAQMPKGLKSPHPLSVALEVDAAGHVSKCDAFEPWGKKQDTSLVGVGCTQLLKQFVAIPAKTDSGTPVASVQNALIMFKIDKTRRGSSQSVGRER